MTAFSPGFAEHGLGFALNGFTNEIMDINRSQGEKQGWVFCPAWLRYRIVNLVRAEIRDNHAVRRTVSIPNWLDVKAADAGISLSKILQEALKARLGV